MSQQGSSSSSSSAGIGFFGLLTVAFIVLKLLGKINWSWWYVLMPSWVPLSILIVFVTIIFIVYLIRNK